MATILVIQFQEGDSKDKAADRLVRLWGAGVMGPDPALRQIAITEVCTDLEKAKEICRLYGGKPVAG